jgi:hypothetical protein
VTADSILELKATTEPFPIMWALGGMFAVTVLALLVVVIFRGNGRKRSVAASPAGAGHAPLAAPYPGASPVGLPPQPASVSQATLQGSAGVFSVSGGAEVRAGRDESKCVVLLTDPSVSGVHASLKIERGQFWVRDDRSNNGTFVDDVRLAPGSWTVLKNGSRLRFGPINFSVRLE